MAEQTEQREVNRNPRVTRDSDGEEYSEAEEVNIPDLYVPDLDNTPLRRAIRNGMALNEDQTIYRIRCPKLKEYIGKDTLTVYLPEGRLKLPTEPPIDFIANCASTPFDQPRLLIEAMQSLVQTQPELTILPGDDTPLVRDRYLSRTELIERLSNYIDLCVMYAESAVRHESAQLHGDREEILRKETHEETLMQRLSSNMDKLLAQMQRDIRFRKTNRKTRYPTPKINPRIAPPVPAQQDKLDKSVDALRIRDHMPDPSNVFGNEATKHLAALVRYWMQNYLLTTQWQYSLVACERDFNLGRTKFERVVSGKKQAGGYEYGKKRKIRPDEQPTGADKPKRKRENPVHRSQVKTGVGCKYCDKVCLNEETLSIHINNEHADRQSLFQCAFCGLRINDFGLYNRHVKEHSDKVHKCYMCSELFDNTRDLSKHIRTHINQCPLCSRAFESLLVLSNHVNSKHLHALQGDHKKCPFCDAAFDTFDELSIHCKEHRSFSCDICYTGFVSEPLLVEHRFNDHPQGRPAWSAPREDPDMEKAMEVIRTPDPNPFVNKATRQLVM